MSTTPIWSLAAKRNELGHATKGQIYLSKIAIGAVVAAVLWLVSLGNGDVIVWASAAAFVTSKVCYFVNTHAWPDSWDTVPDWICDGVLWFGWLFAVHLYHAEWRAAGLMFGLWLLSYPWSAE